MSTFTFLLVLASALMHATWNFIAKRHAGNYSVIYLSFGLSSVVTGLLSIPYLEGLEIVASTTVLLLSTGFLHAVYGFILTFTYQHGDISTLYPIVRGSGIAGSVLLSVVILHELLSGMASIGVMMVIAGIATLSYKRNHAATSPKGIFMALVCGGFIMSYTIIDKMLVDVMHPLPVLAASQVFTLFLFLPYVITERKEEMRLTLRSLKLPAALISVIATTSYLIILYVMQMEDIGRIVTVREASVVFGAVAGYVLLKEHFSKTRLIGVLLVMIGIVLVKL